MNSGEPADPTQLLRPWNLGEPLSVERLGGSNNASWRVTTSPGTYVLRLYRNTGNLPHVEFEHALLGQLAGMGLSFQVPVPIATQAGRTLVPVDVGGAVLWVAVSEAIEGEYPTDWTSLRWVRAAGAALGELDAALAGISLDGGHSGFPLYGELNRIHAAIPNPESAVAHWPLDPALKQAFQAFLASTRASLPRLYDVLLPRQIIHSDLAGSNLLLRGDAVVAILDFEFASHDLRALDLAIGAAQMGAPPGAEGLELDSVRALAEGYGHKARLTPREIESIPDLLRLRSAVSVIHRAGRHLEGLSPFGAVESRVRHALGLERWLVEHRGGVIEALAAASS